LRLGETAPAWSTLSVDPFATLVALATVALGVLAFWTARAAFSAGGSTRSVCRALTFLGALAALTAVLVRAVSPRSVLFMIEPDTRSASPFGAFVNRNHFGGWLLMIATPVAGYFVARARIHPLRRGRWGGSIGQVMSSASCSRRCGIHDRRRPDTRCRGLRWLDWALRRWSRGGWDNAHGSGAHEPAGAARTGRCAAVDLVLFVDVDHWATRASAFEAESSPLSRVTIGGNRCRSRGTSG
jgi:hypothetical protein